MDRRKLTDRLFEIVGSRELIGASYSISVKDKSYNTVFGFETDRFLIPASNIKLLTTATALHLFGPKYQFQTKIYYTGKLVNGNLNGNVIIKGYGDPSFGSRDFESTIPKHIFKKIVEILKDANIEIIEGEILVDNSFIENHFAYGSWSLEDFPFYYGAIPNAVNFLDNYFQIKQNGTELIAEEIDLINLNNLISEFKVFEDPNLQGLKILGCPYCDKKSIYLNPNLDVTKSRDYKVAITKPSLVFVNNLKHFLETKRIRVENNEIKYDVSDKKEIGILLSPPLIEIIKNINFKSNNLFAESVYQVLMKIFEESNQSFNDYWLNTIGNDKFKLNDGSGLSRTSLLTTDFTTELLMFMFLNIDNFGDFFRTLPQVGIEGTVKDYCKDIDSKNILRVKTGSMNGVRSMSGFVLGSEPLSFSMIFNNYQCSEAEINGIRESILIEFALA